MPKSKSTSEPKISAKQEAGGDCHPRLVVPLRVLRLTLKKKWFDMIASGEKTEEYRTSSAWTFSRLIGKEYDVVEFSNGYGKHVPKVVVQYFGWHQGPGRPEWGATRQKRYVVIRLGEVISRHNALGQPSQPPK